MLENTQKIYQLILETEKKFNDEKEKLVKRRETLQKKIDSKIPFSSAAKKREARYEIEEIDSSLEELERDKKQAVLDLEVLPQLKKAHDEDSKTLLANRRARAKGDSSPWIFQRVTCEDEFEGAITYETSRLNFIGRNRNLRFPKVMKQLRKELIEFL